MRPGVDGKTLPEYEPRSFEAGDSSLVLMNGKSGNGLPGPPERSRSRAGEFLRSAGGLET
jgi:hypothetical protein